MEALILKFLLARGDATGREIADQVKLSFVPIEELLRQMKQDQLVFHRGSAAMNDYQFQLTDLGRERGRRHTEHCTYFGAAPVSLSDYIDSVAAQSITRQRPTPANLQHAFDDLLISSKMMNRIGPAINSGRGMFLFGARGNGKNEHCGAHHSCFWAVYLDSASDRRRREIIRLYDPSNHEQAPLEDSGTLIDRRKIDKRWFESAGPRSWWVAN